MDETRLIRNLDEAMLGGVLAGLASRYDWDVTLVRIVAVLLTVATGVVPGVVIYLAAWVIVPPASEQAADVSPDAGGTSDEARPAGPGAVVGEVTAAVQDAAERVEEAGRIAAEAVRQAAEEIGEVVRRPREGGAEAEREDAGAESASADDDDDDEGEVTAK